MCGEVASISDGLVDRELNGGQEAQTAGERAFRRHGFTGARGEAASGYATVRMAALPVYDRLRRDGVAEDVALLEVLLRLLAVNDDTNLVSRGGYLNNATTQHRQCRIRAAFQERMLFVRMFREEPLPRPCVFPSGALTHFPSVRVPETSPVPF
jgi:triphosphoribosyl-dephospho-CoA synthase